MRQDSTFTPRSGFMKFLNDPWSQSVLTGTFTLIPVRNYPQWVRRAIVWGPTVAGAAAPVVLGRSPRLRRKLSTKLALAQHVDPSTRSGLRPQEPPAPVFPSTKRSIGSMVVIGTALGAGMSLLMVGGLWADEKIEQSLRRFNVPLPRVVMGVAAGAFTWWSVKQDQKDKSAHDGH